MKLAIIEVALHDAEDPSDVLARIQALAVQWYADIYGEPPSARTVQQIEDTASVQVEDPVSPDAEWPCHHQNPVRVASGIQACADCGKMRNV